MEIDVEVRDGPPITGIVKVSGLVETPQARHLQKVLKEIDEKGIGRIIFDLAGAPFVSSTGLSLLVSYAKTKRDEWGEACVVLTGLQPAVKKSMEMLGILGLFVTTPDLESALDRFGLS